MCKPAGPLTVQSGPAPGAGALGLALLELKPAAVLARIGASWGNAIFRSYKLWLDIFMFLFGCKQPTNKGSLSVAFPFAGHAFVAHAVEALR